jgi:hypothetical protein
MTIEDWRKRLQDSTLSPHAKATAAQIRNFVDTPQVRAIADQMRSWKENAPAWVEALQRRNLPSEPQSTALAKKKRKSGRPKGISYENADRPLVDKMHTLIVSGNASSATEAAGVVCDKAKGAGTHNSKVRRVVNRYNATYSQS